MSKKELLIPFSIVHIEENQFSYFEDVLTLDKPIEQQIGFGFGADTDQKVIAVTMDFVLQKENVPLLKQSITCYFEISAIDFEQQLTKDAKIVLPCEFSKHLAMITTGTARGVLFANTKNTAFNTYPIGLINIDDMFKEDLIIEL